MRKTKITLHNLEHAMMISSFIWAICGILLHLLHPLEENEVFLAAIVEIIFITGVIISRIIRVRSLTRTS